MARSIPPPGWKPLKGIVTPLATPLSGQDVIDKESTKKLIEHVLAGGVSGIFLLGSTGEGPSLSNECRRTFVEYCIEVVAGRVPVLVSVSDTAFSESVALAKLVAKFSSTAIVLAPPYYFTMSQVELLRYAEQIMKAVPKKLPILLYNIPSLTTNEWGADTVQALAKSYGQIVGIKDSSGDMSYFKELCNIKKTDRPDFVVMIGPEHLLPESIAAGGDGGVNSGSNVLPDLFVNLYQAVVSKDEEKILQLQAGVEVFQELYTVCDPTDHPFSRIIRGTKCALVAKEIISTMCVNEPFVSSHQKRYVEKTITVLLIVESVLRK